MQDPSEVICSAQDHDGSQIHYFSFQVGPTESSLSYLFWQSPLAYGIAVCMYQSMH